MSENKCKVIQFPQVLHAVLRSQSQLEQDKQYIIDYVVPIATDVFKQIRQTGYTVEATHTDIQDFINGFMDCFVKIDKGDLQLSNVVYPQNFEQYTETVEIAYIEASKQGKDVSIAYCLGFVYFAVYVHED